MLHNDKYIDEEFNEDVEFDSNMVLRDDIIYEISDNIDDDNEAYSPISPHNLSDRISEKTCSSMENDLEAILYDYTIIIDCLMSVRYQRSQSEIAIISQLLQSIPDFMHINATAIEYVCQAAKLLIIENANQIIVKKCSVLNEWYLCLHGCLRQEGAMTNFLGPGTYIGTDLWSKETLISDYDLFSDCDNCKLLAIGLGDLEPMNQLNKVIIKTSDEDKSVIAVYEAFTNVRSKDDMCSYVLTKGTIEVLISHLLSSRKWVSADFVEDFFLTRKIFLKSTEKIRHEIFESLFSENDLFKEKFDALIRWLSQNYFDFENSAKKLSFIDEIVRILKKQNNEHCLYLLYECCSNCATVREIQERVPLIDCVVPVPLSNDQTMFYVSQINNVNSNLRIGDVLLELEGKRGKAITLERIKALTDEARPIAIVIKNDLLGYHEHVLKDIRPDTVSIKSTPSNSHYTRCLSVQMANPASISTNDIDLTTGRSLGKLIQKRPIILPNFFSTLQTGSIGKFLKNPKHYAKSAIQNGSRSNSDVTARIDNLQNGNRDLAGSNVSIARFSRRLKSKRRRRSIGSNTDLIKSFDDLDLTERDCPASGKAPIRIHIKDQLIGNGYTSTGKSDARHFHFMIEPTTTVTEVIVRSLLKLNLSSASSTKFFIVEVKVNDSNGMIHQKILHPETCNLIDRLKEHSKFYLKHESVFGERIIPQSEADRMMKEFQSPSVEELSLNGLVVRLFLRSYKLLCQLQPSELIRHVTANKSTLKYRKEVNTPSDRMLEYMNLSDFYKYWVITEICRDEGNTLSRASTIQYFINLALKAMYVGHIDLFFSVISGLESMEVLRLNNSWDKVPKRDKKLFRNLKTTLDVTGNMRNLRIIHQRIANPLIPVTAMVVKDLTMLEETHPTFVTGSINGLPVNENLVNFDKMQKMSKLTRNFVNSCCACGNDRSRPVMKHLRTCKKKWENLGNLERFLQQRLESQTDTSSPKLVSQTTTGKLNRKYSFSNTSTHSSSSESLTESLSSLKTPDEKTSAQIFDQRMMTMKIERYLQTLESRVVIDESTLSEMSFSCEENVHNDGIYETKLRNSSKHSKTKEYYSTNGRLSNGIDLRKSDKATEILGMKADSSDSDDLTNSRTLP